MGPRQTSLKVCERECSPQTPIQLVYLQSWWIGTILPTRKELHAHERTVLNGNEHQKMKKCSKIMNSNDCWKSLAWFVGKAYRKPWILPLKIWVSFLQMFPTLGWTSWNPSERHLVRWKLHPYGEKTLALRGGAQLAVAVATSSGVAKQTSNASSWNSWILTFFLFDERWWSCEL